MPPARRDLHFVLAQTLLLVTGDKEGVLRHLLAAEEAGIIPQQLAGDTLVRIAILARELGHREVAIAHYRKFMATFQHDGRAYMLGEQLKALEADAPPPAEPARTPAIPPLPAMTAIPAVPSPASASEPSTVPDPANGAASTPTPSR